MAVTHRPPSHLEDGVRGRQRAKGIGHGARGRSKERHRRSQHQDAHRASAKNNGRSGAAVKIGAVKITMEKKKHGLPYIE